MKILMLHGINHNMFGKRDPAQYGTITLAEIDAQLQKLGRDTSRSKWRWARRLWFTPLSIIESAPLRKPKTPEREREGVDRTAQTPARVPAPLPV